MTRPILSRSRANAVSNIQYGVMLGLLTVSNSRRLPVRQPLVSGVCLVCRVLEHSRNGLEIPARGRG